MCIHRLPLWGGGKHSLLLRPFIPPLVIANQTRHASSSQLEVTLYLLGWRGGGTVWSAVTLWSWWDWAVLMPSAHTWDSHPVSGPGAKSSQWRFFFFFNSLKSSFLFPLDLLTHSPRLENEVSKSYWLSLSSGNMKFWRLLWHVLIKHCMPGKQRKERRGEKKKGKL